MFPPVAQTLRQTVRLSPFSERAQDDKFVLSLDKIGIWRVEICNADKPHISDYIVYTPPHHHQCHLPVKVKNIQLQNIVIKITLVLLGWYNIWISFKQAVKSNIYHWNYWMICDRRSFKFEITPPPSLEIYRWNGQVICERCIKILINNDCSIQIWVIIFNHSKLWVAAARHSFEWVKI